MIVSNHGMDMTSVSNNGQTAIIRTERGLTISGTSITLYDVMDYLKFIRSLFDLTEEQINVALSYIKTHREQVESEYQIFLKEAE